MQAAPTEHTTPAVGAWAFTPASAAGITPDPSQALTFFAALFPAAAGQSIHFRSVPEPKRENEHPRNLHYALDQNFENNLRGFLEYCAVTKQAAFFLPGVVQGSGTGKKDVLSLPAVLVDFDKGNPSANLAAAEALLGPATVIVESGGTVDGHAKLHAHWKLADGQDVETVCRVREALALRFGGDPAFKQAGQVIRLPGSVHFKGTPKLVQLRTVRPEAAYDLHPLVAAIGNVAPAKPANTDNFFNFNNVSTAHVPSVEDLRTMRVETEGKSEVTRWEWFSRVAGAEIADVRAGRKSLEAAEQYMLGAVQRNMEHPEDWGDARVAREFASLARLDVEARGSFPTFAPAVSPQEWASFDQWTGDSDHFRGAPVPRKYLIDGVLPIGVPGIVCAAGGLGKSYLMLDLAFRVATGTPVVGMDFNREQLILGGAVKEFGTAVCFFAEDDRLTIHERLAALDPAGKRFDKPFKGRLRPIPLPEAGGPRALFVSDRDGYKTSPFYEATRAWLKTLPDLRLVCFDPLQTLVAADITSKPEAGQFVMATLGTLAVELGATILVTHHMRKTQDAIASPEEARAAMRGTTALVDGVRFAYALWEAPGEAGGVASGAVVKTNGRSDTRVHRYQRLPCGVLRQLPPEFDPEARAERLEALAAAIGKAAAEGRPFTSTGENGLHKQQHRLPAPFKTMARDPLETMAKQLLLDGRLVKGTARGSKTRGVLDVPGGDFALGNGTLMSGAGEFDAA